MYEKIYILCLQETEINKNLNHDLLSFPGFGIETENSSNVARVAIYINNNIQYSRRRDLEVVDSY